jgi:5,10-methylenetetrahydrofolate reductase
MGADAVNVADSPMARVRMSALSLCVQIQQQVGIESIVHFTTRDRSLMGLQADLIGAHALGVRNILALTGDPPSLGDTKQSDRGLRRGQHRAGAHHRPLQRGRRSGRAGDGA